jgi:hypothetical protein
MRRLGKLEAYWPIMRNYRRVFLRNIDSVVRVDDMVRLGNAYDAAIIFNRLHRD